MPYDTDCSSSAYAIGAGQVCVPVEGEGTMDVVFARRAGIDMHKRTVAAGCLTPDVQGQRVRACLAIAVWSRACRSPAA